MHAESSRPAIDDGPPQCPVCLTGTVRPYCRKQQARYFLCRGCGLIFQHPPPTSLAMRAWADAEYTAGAYHDYVAARPMKIRHFEDRLRDISGVVKPGRLLDVGCSCGFFLEVAASKGFDVRGVEFSRSAIEASSPGIRPRIFEGTLDTMPADGLFDVASAFDLIEHVTDPRAFFRRCRALLKPGGTLVLSTPDTGHALRFLMGCRWPMLQPMQHLSLFSRRSLELALRAEGFTTVMLEACYKTLSIDYLIDQIKPLNPLLARSLNTLARAVPRSVLGKHRRINIGEILSVSHRA